MANKFTIEKWFKLSIKLILGNWQEWVKYSLLFSLLAFGILFFFLKEIILPGVSLLTKESPSVEDLMVFLPKIISIVIAYTSLFIFADLFMIQITSQMYSGKKVSFEETMGIVLGSLPMFLVLTISYVLLSIVSFLLFVIPALLVSFFFLFIYQALIIEKKGIDSFGRSYELTKNNFTQLMFLPLVVYVITQILFLVPFYTLSSLGELFIKDLITKSSEPMDIFNQIIESPMIYLFFGGLVLIMGFQSTLKTILYTIAFEISREEK